MIGFSNMWIFMIVFGVLRVLVIAGVIYLVYRLLINNNAKTREVDTSRRAIEILKEKYALGEISEEEYQRRLKILKEQ